MLSYPAVVILKAISSGCAYRFSVMAMTGLPSGTVYPVMRRLERNGLILSQWEVKGIVMVGQRPPRKHYQLTAEGRSTLESCLKRYPLAREADLAFES